MKKKYIKTHANQTYRFMYTFIYIFVIVNASKIKNTASVQEGALFHSFHAQWRKF